ncbi:tetratricopeptide repeat protein [Clostridium formicaceticum]|uniref:Photosystem I assembly protein Ycf3 n=1 Tax=Clostridium formicaceticum TaxID=1497 RepID=A0AAC9WFI8_9CLOT|nr:tetratricopeptide repeat protein [Clostridium formicaceticum]AOY76452.1 hypothetical protein BJL90_11350 [Clostridium formicaceticum]ARE86848.1 photosystem I assembly protein Ycf3 [Clostridium formicaceticum]
MKFLIDAYLLKKTEELSFVHLKHDAALKIKAYHLPSAGLDVPILTTELAENIKKKKESEVITIGSIIRGMVYLLGIDPEFKYKEEYIKFLYAANPQVEEYVLVEGLKYLNSYKLLEGIIFFKALVFLNPNSVEGLLNYALALLDYRDQELVDKKKNYKLFTKEAQEKLETLLNLDPQQPLAYYYLGFIYKDQKAFNKAKFHWEKAMLLDLDEGIKEQIKECLFQLEDMAQYERGYETILAGKPEEGLPLLEGLYEKYQGWWNLVFFVGLGHRQLGNFHEAIQYFKRVLELNKDQLDAMVELGLCYGGLGELQKAIEYFHRAIEIGGEDSEILCNLAMMYMEIGDLQKAGESISASLRLNPEDEITLACKNKLEAMK